MPQQCILTNSLSWINNISSRGPLFWHPEALRQRQPIDCSSARKCITGRCKSPYFGYDEVIASRNDPAETANGRKKLEWFCWRRLGSSYVRWVGANQPFSHHRTLLDLTREWYPFVRGVLVRIASVRDLPGKRYTMQKAIRLRGCRKSKIRSSTWPKLRKRGCTQESGYRVDEWVNRFVRRLEYAQI